MNPTIKKLVYPLYSAINNQSVVQNFKINRYLKNGQIPWSLGYTDYKYREIERTITDSALLENFRSQDIPNNFGYGIDERIFEYGWIFSRMSDKSNKTLDAGSTFNYKFILNTPVISKKDLTIFTFYPEVPSYPNLPKVDYKYGDLRKMEFADNSFDEVISQSTIEHIDMDNEIYGYDLEKNEDSNKKSFDYLIAVGEMERVLKSKGKLLLTFPYGKFKHYGFFQQFDVEMVQKIVDLLSPKGKVSTEFALYDKNGWKYAEQGACNSSLSFNPHTGEDKGNDGAAHCRSVCLIEFIKH